MPTETNKPITRTDLIKPNPADPIYPDQEIPERLLRAMRRAVAPENWLTMECRLKRGFNKRLARSDKTADDWVERETQAFNDAAKHKLVAGFTRAAAAAGAAAAYFITRFPWR